jgi:hypothetical protein
MGNIATSKLIPRIKVTCTVKALFVLFLITKYNSAIPKVIKFSSNEV